MRKLKLRTAQSWAMVTYLMSVKVKTGASGTDFNSARNRPIPKIYMTKNIPITKIQSAFCRSFFGVLKLFYLA